MCSAGVSLLYVGYTWSVYRVACRLKDCRLSRFFARNTVFIFVAHMPLYYGLEGPLRAAVSSRLGRVTILFVACFVGLAIGSELLRRLIHLDRLRDRLWPAETIPLQTASAPDCPPQWEPLG
jgi:hypothetical protein